MMIVISVFYVVMVFGTTGILNAQKGPEYDSPLDRVGGVLETRTGPMNLRAVGAQILAVPIGMVFLGLTVLVARDRKSVVAGKRVSVRVELGGGRLLKKNKKSKYET